MGDQQTPSIPFAEEARPRRKLNRLSQPQLFKLTTWLSTQRERLQRERPHLTEVVDQVGKALGLDVTESNIEFALTAAEFTWEPAAPLARGSYIGGVRRDVKALADLLAELTARVARLEAELTQTRARMMALEHQVVPLKVMK